MIPQAANFQINNSSSQTSKTYYLDLDNKRIVDKIDGVKSVEQAIKKIILTEKRAYLIYDWFYGIGIQKYIGKDYYYIAADIQNTIKEAVKIDDRILTINSVELKKVGIDACYVVYNVTSTEGEVAGEVQVL